MQGPSFVSEPPSRVEFTNVNGGRVDCIVRGNPAPTVDWLAADGGSITSIPGIRHVLGNGTIHFPGFEAEIFRQDVHWAIYKCSAVNSVGGIVSRDVTVRAGTRNFSLVICILPFYPILSCAPSREQPLLEPFRRRFFHRGREKEEEMVSVRWKNLEIWRYLSRLPPSSRFLSQAMARIYTSETPLVWGVK